MARSELFLKPLFRKAQLKSGADIGAARGRMLAYSQRSAGVRIELVRRAIGNAVFAPDASEKSAAPRSDFRPFTAEQLTLMQSRVEAAVERAIIAAGGRDDPAAVRMAMWQATKSDPELADAVAGLLILAQL